MADSGWASEDYRAGRLEGAREEREAVVRWLRQQAGKAHDLAMLSDAGFRLLSVTAGEIEAGGHRKGGA